jgi:hypothetical protein
LTLSSRPGEQGAVLSYAWFFAWHPDLAWRWGVAWAIAAPLALGWIVYAWARAREKTYY